MRKIYVIIFVFLFWVSGVVFTYGAVLAGNTALRERLGGHYASMSVEASKQQDWSDAVVIGVAFPVTSLIALGAYLQYGWRWRKP